MNSLIKSIKIIKIIIKTIPMFIMYSLILICLKITCTYLELDMIKQLSALIRSDNINIITLTTIKYVMIIIICMSYDSLYKNYLQPKYRHIFTTKIQNILLCKINNICIIEREKPENYDKMSRALKSVDKHLFTILQEYITWLIGIGNIFAIGSLLLDIDLLVTLLVFINVLIIVIFNLKSVKIKFKFEQESEKNLRKFNYFNRIYYLKSYLDIIKTKNVNSIIDTKLNEEFKEYDSKSNTYEWLYIKREFLKNIISSLFRYAIIYLYVFFKIIKDIFVFESLIVLLGGIVRLEENMLLFSKILLNNKKNKLYIDEFLWLYNKDSKKFNNNCLSEISRIEIQNLKFKYNLDSKYTLKIDNLIFEKNNIYGIVGKNGSGKSTFIKVLLNLYKINFGSIHYVGEQTECINEQFICDNVLSVFQESKLFPTDIASNVLLKSCVSSEDEENVINALETVGLYEKISKLRNGIFTKIGSENFDEGINFSNGEIQKILIARAFATKKNVIILDEPTSNMDINSENQILKKLIELSNNKIIIMITHRLSNLVNFDKIIVMNNGEVLGQGKHEELLNNNALYNELFNTQSSIYN
ncbi:MAG: ABC transporter ATP-binding protein [Bacilli bacterium]|nr:ABC transporter ATP-binding protein [Bacilli bacterium]